MVESKLKARPVKDIVFTLDGTNYEEHVNNVLWSDASTGSTVLFQGGTPDAVIRDVPAAAYNCAITLAQDVQSTDSLFNYMLKNPGKTCTAVYKPHADGPFTLTASITIPRLSIGGAMNVVHDVQVTCSSTVPVPTWPAAAGS